jgi:hypothetical protein
MEARHGSKGYVFATPSFVDEARRLEESLSGLVEWDESNCHKAVRSVLDGAGYKWQRATAFGALWRLSPRRVARRSWTLQTSSAIPTRR